MLVPFKDGRNNPTGARSPSAIDAKRGLVVVAWDRMAVRVTMRIIEHLRRG
jgi:hypothetical protein